MLENTLSVSGSHRTLKQVGIGRRACRTDTKQLEGKLLKVHTQTETA